MIYNIRMNFDDYIELMKFDDYIADKNKLNTHF